MRATKLVLFVISLVLSFACSQQQMYHAAQENAKSRCLMKEPPSQYQECVEKASVPYSDYEKLRDDINKDK